MSDFTKNYLKVALPLTHFQTHCVLQLSQHRLDSTIQPLLTNLQVLPYIDNARTGIHLFPSIICFSYFCLYPLYLISLCISPIIT